jgi:hypothetical protein
VGDQQTPVDRPLTELGLKRNAVLRGPCFVPAIFTVARSDLILTVPRRMGKIAAAIAAVLLIVADRKSDNKKVSFDRAILFELFMIPCE